MAQLSTDCSICCDTFTKSKRAPITCKKCGLRVCRTCLEKYILTNESLTQILCMTPDCGCVWDRGFLAQHLTQICMRKKYPRHRGDLLFQHEISRLPETMPFVETRKRLDGLRKNRREITAKAREIRTHLRELNNQLYYLGREMHQLERDDGTSRTPTQEAREFVRQCPADDCRGFLSTQWRCRLCELYVCSKCHGIKGRVPKGIKPTCAFTDHVCNENDVKTVAMLRKDTKPCPACGVPINKISGCDQMWCTQCQVAFSWRTGRRINGVIHNPHFYAWQRERAAGNAAPRAHGDVRCGGFPRYGHIRQQLSASDKGRAVKNTYHVPAGEPMPTSREDAIARNISTWGAELLRLHRALLHFNRVELPSYAPSDGVREKRKLRVDYILGNKDDDSMKQRLISLDKKNIRENDIYHVLQLMDTVGMERFIAVAADMSIENVKLCFDECERVRNYCNGELKKISAMDGLMVPIIGNNFYVDTDRFSKKAVGW